jgi:hypothetical protein
VTRGPERTHPEVPLTPVSRTLVDAITAILVEETRGRKIDEETGLLEV